MVIRSRGEHSSLAKVTSLCLQELRIHWEEKEKSRIGWFQWERVWWDAGWWFVFWSCARSKASMHSMTVRYESIKICVSGLEICCSSCLFKVTAIGRVTAPHSFPLERKFQQFRKEALFLTRVYNCMCTHLFIYKHMCTFKIRPKVFH